MRRNSALAVAPALLALAAAWAPSAAPGQLAFQPAATTIRQAAPGQPLPVPPPTVITLRPAGEPVPALKYQLVPERNSLVPGNAALLYHRAIQILLESRTRTRAGE